MTSDTTFLIDSFVAKLERRKPLPPGARGELLTLPYKLLQVDAQDTVVRQGAESRTSYFVASGFLSRQKRTGREQQIMALAIAGDAVDLQSLWFHKQDHTLVAHKRTTLIAIEHDEIAGLCERSPHVAKALWHDCLVDAAIFREWTLNVGHRRARQRLAHLYLEMAARQNAHGLVQGDTFDLPLTQGELASALGLSLVHINKSLKALRDQGLVEVDGRIVTLLDRRALESSTGFDPTYLHISSEPRF